MHVLPPHRHHHRSPSSCARSAPPLCLCSSCALCRTSLNAVCSIETVCVSHDLHESSSSLLRHQLFESYLCNFTTIYSCSFFIINPEAIKVAIFASKKEVCDIYRPSSTFADFLHDYKCFGNDEHFEHTCAGGAPRLPVTQPCCTVDIVNCCRCGCIARKVGGWRGEAAGDWSTSFSSRSRPLLPDDSTVVKTLKTSSKLESNDC